MKKLILHSFIVGLFSILCFTHCKKKNNDTTSNLSETPIAKAEYDASNYGIYKGVFVGSSGIVVIDINNSDELKATLTIDKVTYNLVVKPGLNQGKTTVEKDQSTVMVFSQDIDDGNMFRFRVGADGLNPVVENVSIRGHDNPSIVVMKESSTDIVKCYEGIYSGDDNGVFNAVIYKDKMKALTYSTSYKFGYTAQGTISNNQINGSATTGATISGTLNGNNFSGTWKNNSLKGTWSGTRTY